jgi:hypothetical protein
MAINHLHSSSDIRNRRVGHNNNAQMLGKGANASGG